MRTQRYGKTVKVWLSERDTYNWANRPGASWPCSELFNKRVFAEFDHGDLVNVQINGRDRDVPIDEFNAMIEDFLGSVNPE